MKLTGLYREGELSSICVSSEAETVEEVKSLFFIEQLIEESILLELHSENKNAVSDLDEVRLDFDRIYSKKELRKKAIFSFHKIVDSSAMKQEFSMETILTIKNQQRFLNGLFRNYIVLKPKAKLFSKTKEPMLFAALKNDNYYLVNPQLSKVKKSNGLKTFKNWLKKGIFSKMSSK